MTREYFFVCKGMKCGFKSACKECMGFKVILDGTKLCSKCNTIFPATAEYFHKHKNKKYGIVSVCKNCVAIKDKKYREENKEQISQKKREYRIANADYVKKKKSDYYFSNRERILNKNKRYYIKNKDVMIDRAHEYYEKNKEHVLELVKIYRKNNPHVDQIKTQKRKSLKAMLPSDFDKNQWGKCKETFDNKCAYCGKDEPLAQEHFIPLSKGGEFTINNIVPACKSCNSKKFTNDFFEWYPKQKFYSKQREQKILKYLGYKNNTQQLALL